jgi:hypothetical protein
VQVLGGKKNPGGFTLTPFFCCHSAIPLLFWQKIPKMGRHNRISSIFIGLSTRLHISSLISHWQRFAAPQGH